MDLNFQLQNWHELAYRAQPSKQPSHIFSNSYTNLMSLTWAVRVHINLIRNKTQYSLCLWSRSSYRNVINYFSYKIMNTTFLLWLYICLDVASSTRKRGKKCRWTAHRQELSCQSEQIVPLNCQNVLRALTKIQITEIKWRHVQLKSAGIIKEG